MATETDVFYSAACTFWTDDWALMRGGRAQRHSPIPCCPHCGSVGFELDRDLWWQGVREHEANGHPGYVAMIVWGRNRCFKSYDALAIAYVSRPDAEGP